ncbi:MAG TPA: hypothetical protein VFB07_13020 [Vicinamibacterales bacterium]|nr:hypothetical protein [Vicinamibacterales bacterium]
MNVVTIIVAVGVLMTIVVAILSRRSRPGADLGFVSHSWVAEHRLSQASTERQ